MLSFENEMLPNKTHLQFLFVLKHVVVIYVILHHILVILKVVQQFIEIA